MVAAQAVGVGPRLLPRLPDRDDATTDARHRLVEAVEHMEEVRQARCSGAAPDRGLWKGLAARRWTLVDHFESGGRRYAIALRSDDAFGGFESLSPRELEVVARSARGLSNKYVAYDMGLAVSTVRVLLHRAAKKLGVATCRELIARYVAEAETR